MFRRWATVLGFLSFLFSILATDALGVVQYSVKDLGTLPGCLEPSATGINSTGQVVGSIITTGGYYHAFLYSNGNMTDLGTIPGSVNSWASGINDSGQVVGDYNYAINSNDKTPTIITPSFTVMGR
jgi:probable HAF family extracellular repeat protein